MREEHGHGLLYYRAKCRNLYEHTRTQYCVAVLIILAFAVDIGEAQLLPQGCGEKGWAREPKPTGQLTPCRTGDLAHEPARKTACEKRRKEAHADSGRKFCEKQTFAC